MLVTFRKIRSNKHEFRAQDKDKVYQGSLDASPSDRGSTLISITSYPSLDKEKAGEVMSKFVEYKRQMN
ncbi:hypothetical protein [Aureispira sp. CCB-E]|uniref:hypothetical protein n=2 Tax=unclassified Aureispira TaxID=2649989 RepID=UPI0028693090|nr:hypothetical protein [Aureispira sp. CCB-E]WMX17104.1 hypothetical protein QP953_12040 [Aureispira sp. CCB-E]